ncbi:MAG TPA: hypothetical protein VLD59_04795 [Steroidobacteraceae bacterium]|nr:hypothetical protein [Steroidobacteraceae bacterium]
MRDDYKQLPTPEGLEHCPCCGGAAEFWRYSKSDDGPATKVVMCTINEPIGPQDGLVHEGCPLYMPPDCHYRATEREAVKFWNEFAKALTALQRKNRWDHRSALRAPTALGPTPCAAEPAEDPDVWPIVNVTVDEAGKITDAKLYAPGLPAGNHDVYPVKVPYINEHTEAWQAVCRELDAVRPGWILGQRSGIECAVAAIRAIAEAGRLLDGRTHDDFPE